MREELKEIFQDAWIAADFIQKAKDVIEARPLVQMAHKAIAELAEEAKNLPPEVEPEPVIEPEPTSDEGEGEGEETKSKGVRRI